MDDAMITVPTQPQLATIEYTVTNGDNESRQLNAVEENGEGEVVGELSNPESTPSESVGTGGGVAPDVGPYTITFSAESTAEAYGWDVNKCARIRHQVRITSDGGSTIEWTSARINHGLSASPRPQGRLVPSSVDRSCSGGETSEPAMSAR